MKLLGVSTVGATLVGVDTMWGVPDQLLEEAQRGPGIVSFKKSVCTLCRGGCGINVRLVDNIPVHIDGSVDHPVNQGGICPHGAAGLDFLYHPDRIQGPLIRAGARGEGRWRQVTWDEAIAVVAERLTQLRESGNPQHLAFLTSDDRGLMYEVIRNFTQSIGSPNLISVNGMRSEAFPYEMMFGWQDLPGFDIANARFLMGFGTNLLEEGSSPVHAINAFSQMRDRNVGRRGRFVFADPRYSLTASKADTYLPIRAGTHGALALGIAYVLIRERYYDVEFVHKHVSGFESSVASDGSTRKGFREWVQESYYPDRVAQITGIPASTIVAVARDFGRIRPSVAVFGPHASGGNNGLFNALAVSTLNVLVGNVEKPGGMRFTRRTPFRELPRPSVDKIASTGLSKTPLHAHDGTDGQDVEPMDAFCTGVMEESPNPIDTLFVFGCNPAFDHLRARRFRGALERIPFVVTFATIMDETSEYADVIFPNHSYLESWMDSGATRGVAFPHAAVSAPIMKPMYNTRATGDVLIEILESVVGGTEQWCPGGDFLSLLKSRMQGIYRSGEGTVISGSFEESWVRFLKARGWQNLVYESFDDFWALLVERGGWWNPIGESLSPAEVIQKDDKRISLRLHDMLESGVDAQEYTEKPRMEGEESEYPYSLMTFGVLANRDGTGSCSPLLQEMFGYSHRVYWDSWAEISPLTAHQHELDDGDRVTITSPRGSITTRVVLNEAAEPHTVSIPFGLGHTSGGRYARGVGVNPYEIVGEVADALWPRPVSLSTRVKIEKAEGGKT